MPSDYLNHCWLIVNLTLRNKFEWNPLQWRHSGHDGISNHQPHDCLLNRLFKTQIKENIKAPSYWPLYGEFTGDRLNSPHKWPVAWKMFPFDDVIMLKNFTTFSYKQWIPACCLQNGNYFFLGLTVLNKLKLLGVESLFYSTLLLIYSIDCQYNLVRIFICLCHWEQCY